MSDAEYEALVSELETLSVRYGAHLGPDSFLTPLQVWNEPSLALESLLYMDALGESVLPDDVVARLWEISWLLDCDPEDVMPERTLAKAREGRRTRPVQPIRYPLRGGGHGSGRGNPGKSEFPQRWSDNEAVAHTMSVASSPDGAVEQPDGTFRAWGTRDGVDLRVIVTVQGEVVTAYPVAGDGVVHNPLDEERTPYVERLQRLVDATSMEDAVRAGIDELMAVGEWDQVVLHLRALPVADLDELQALGTAAGLDDVN